MLTDEIEDAEDTTPEAVREGYERDIAEVVESVGVDAAAEGTGIDRDALTALLDGEASPPSLTLEETASLLALGEDAPPADAIVAEVRDHLMLQMSSAVMDVDALAAGLDGNLDPKEIQQKIEGRQPLTLAEYARIHRLVAAENPF